MEPENENVEPTRSLFGGTAHVTGADAEDSTVGVDTVDTESTAVEEVVADDNETVVEPSVDEEAIANEPEPVFEEPEEIESVVEKPAEVVVQEAGDIPLETAPEPESNGTETTEETAVVSTEPMEDIIPSVEATVDEVEPEKELPEIAKLKAEREKLDEAIHSKQLQERKSVMSQIAAVVKLYDIPLLELFTTLGGIPNPRKGEKAPITHRDDQGNTWTGRGRTPRWLKDKNPDDYRV